MPVLILAGAPDGKTLDWDTPGLLVEPFRGPAPPPSSADSDPGPASAPSFLAGHATWRSIPLRTTHIPTGFSQRYHGFVDPESSFDSDPDGRSQFHEHSLAVFEDLPSSDLQGPTYSLLTDGSASFESTSISQDPHVSGTFQAKSALSIRGNLSNLQDIPSASYLKGIEPATKAVNVICGIISIAAPKTIRTRWGSRRCLVETLFGDDTRAGFAVTFWLPSDHKVEESLLAGLRLQDVVLLQNVALSVWDNKVYGSSLRQGQTKVHLLYRRKLGLETFSGYYSPADMTAHSGLHAQLVKTRAVWDWALRFVSAQPRHEDQEKPPPETQ